MAATSSDEFKRDAARIALTSALTRRQVASDLGIGLSTLGKWVRAVAEEAKAPEQDADLLPPPIFALPFHFPDWREPGEAGGLLAAHGAQFRHVDDERDGGKSLHRLSR